MIHVRKIFILVLKQGEKRMDYIMRNVWAGKVLLILLLMTQVGWADVWSKDYVCEPGYVDTPSHTGCVLPTAKIFQWPAQPIPDGITDSGQSVYLSYQYKQSIKFSKYRCYEEPLITISAKNNGSNWNESTGGDFICSPIKESK